MSAVGTERQPQEVALMSILGEAIIRKIGELISFEVQNRDGLVCLTLLRAISVVQRRGVAIVGAERESGRKTIDRSHSAGRRHV